MSDIKEEIGATEINVTTADDIKKESKDFNRKVNMIIAAVILVLVGGYFVMKWSAESKMEYIDGNVLKIARTGSASVGNPWKNASLVGQLAFRSLFLTDSGFTDIEPELGKSIDVSDDGLTYTIVMKDNLKWSDGETLDAEDVVFSMEAFLLCEGVNTTLSSAFYKILGYEDFRDGKTSSCEGITLDGNTITIVLDVPHTSFALTMTQFVVLPEHILKNEDPTQFTSGLAFFTNPVTSGMFMVDKVNELGDLELIQNPHYEAPQTDIERVILYGDYLNMRIDQYSTTNLTEMVSYRSIPGMKEYNVNVYFYRYFVFNVMADYLLPQEVPMLDENGEPVLDEEGEPILTTSTEPNEYDNDNREPNTAVADPRVRQAITHAIDIKSIFSDVYYDIGQLAYGGSLALAKEVYEYNPTKAKALLEEAGYDFDRPFTIAYYHSDTNTTVMLERVKEYLEDIGLTVRLVRAFGNVNLYEMREYDMFLKALSAFNTEDWYNEYISTNATMSQVIGTDAFDELVGTLSSSGADMELFVQTLQELVTLEQELMHKIPLYTLGDSVYINSNRVSVPDDMSFGNTRYRSDLRVDEWSIKKQ